MNKITIENLAIDAFLVITGLAVIGLVGTLTFQSMLPPVPVQASSVVTTLQIPLDDMNDAALTEKEIQSPQQRYFAFLCNEKKGAMNAKISVTSRTSSTAQGVATVSCVTRATTTSQ